MPTPLPPSGIKLKDLCAKLAVDYDEARYALARGDLPTAIASSEPGRGHHRVFDNAQAFYLAVCLKLKTAGVQTALAARIANWSRHIQDWAQNGGWDYEFAPFAGQLNTQHQWYIDIGDARFARVVTDANPSQVGLDVMPWVDMTVRQECRTARPAIVFRVDIGRIAEQLQGCESSSQPPSKHKRKASRKAPPPATPAQPVASADRPRTRRKAVRT